MSDDNTTSPGEVERLLREQHEAMSDVMELRRLSSTPEQRAKAEGAIAVWRRVADYLAALTPPSSPASADRDYHRGIHDAALALDARGHDALAGIVRSLLHKPDYLSPASAEAGEIEPCSTCGALPCDQVNKPAVPDELAWLASVFADEVIIRIRDMLLRGESLTIEDQRHLLDQCIADRKRATLSSPSPALRVAEEALEHVLNGSLSLPRFAEDAARTALATIRAEQGDAR